MYLPQLLGSDAVYVQSGTIESQTASSVVAWLAEHRLKAKLTLVFMTPGGDVHSALAIYDAIKLMTGNTEIHLVVLGECQSAGTLIINAVEPEFRHTGPGTRFMIHAVTASRDGHSVTCDPSRPPPHVLRIIEGNSGLELDEIYLLQEKLVEILSEGTRLQAKQILEMLERSTYFSAEEAVEYGLVGNILQPEPKRDPKKRRWYFLWLRRR